MRQFEVARHTQRAAFVLVLSDDGEEVYKSSYSNEMDATSDGEEYVQYGLMPHSRNVPNGFHIDFGDTNNRFRVMGFLKSIDPERRRRI